jgi:hypothetical protein
MNYRTTANIAVITTILFFGVVIVLNTYSHSIAHWSLGELLANYEGGFVRRGIVGQIAYMTGDPFYYVNLFQKLAISFFVIGSAFLVLVYKQILSKLFYSFMIILAPGGLYDMAIGGGFEYLDRKEIWFYNAIILLIFASKKYNFYSYKVTLFAALISVFMILHHELFAVFFSPVIFLMYLLQKRSDKKVFTSNTMIYAVFTITTFFLVTYFHGNAEIVSAIKESYVEYQLNSNGGINALAWPFSKSNELSLVALTRGSLAYWIFFFGIALVMSVLFILSTFKRNDYIAIAMIINLSLFLSTLIASYAGWDWGRWISIYSIGVALIISLLKVVLSNLECEKKYRFKEDNILSGVKLYKVKFLTLIITISLLMLFLTLVTRMAVCCDQPPVIDLIPIDQSIQNLDFKPSKQAY